MMGTEQKPTDPQVHEIVFSMTRFINYFLEH